MGSSLFFVTVCYGLIEINTHWEVASYLCLWDKFSNISVQGVIQHTIYAK